MEGDDNPDNTERESKSRSRSRSISRSKSPQSKSRSRSRSRSKSNSRSPTPIAPKRKSVRSSSRDVGRSSKSSSPARVSSRRKENRSPAGRRNSLSPAQGTSRRKASRSPAARKRSTSPDQRKSGPGPSHANSESDNLDRGSKRRSRSPTRQVNGPLPKKRLIEDSDDETLVTTVASEPNILPDPSSSTPTPDNSETTPPPQLSSLEEAKIKLDTRTRSESTDSVKKTNGRMKGKESARRNVVASEHDGVSLYVSQSNDLIPESFFASPMPTPELLSCSQLNALIPKHFFDTPFDASYPPSPATSPLLWESSDPHLSPSFQTPLLKPATQPPAPLSPSNHSPISSQPTSPSFHNQIGDVLDSPLSPLLYFSDSIQSDLGYGSLLLHCTHAFDCPQPQICNSIDACIQNASLYCQNWPFDVCCGCGRRCPTMDHCDGRDQCTALNNF